MNNFPKPNIVVSKCLGFAKCRYNGDIIPDPVVNSLKNYVNFQPVCPEVEIGLGIPRDPIRIIQAKGKKYLFQPATSKDVTKEMIAFTDTFLNSLSGIDGFIFKYSSPSCGISRVKIYNGFDTNSSPTYGKGFFGGEAIERFPGIAIEDEGRLKNFTIREYFFTKVFTLAQFRLIKQKKQTNELVKFHTINKLLFMAHNQVKLKALGNIVANQPKNPINTVLAEYEATLYDLLKKAPSFTAWINVLQHAFGGVSKKLNKPERKFFLNSIEEYRDERIPLSVLTKLIYSWAIRFQDEYLLNQTFLQPFPEDLVEITDSGKGRNR